MWVRVAPNLRPILPKNAWDLDTPKGWNKYESSRTSNLYKYKFTAWGDRERGQIFDFFYNFLDPAKSFIFSHILAAYMCSWSSIIFHHLSTKIVHYPLDPRNLRRAAGCFSALGGFWDLQSSHFDPVETWMWSHGSKFQIQTKLQYWMDLACLCPISFMKVSSDEDDTKRFIPFRANLPNNSAAGHDQRLAHLPCDRACLARFAKDLGMASLIRQPLKAFWFYKQLQCFLA